jgi:hypothetical protein
MKNLPSQRVPCYSQRLLEDRTQSTGCCVNLPSSRPTTVQRTSQRSWLTHRGWLLLLVLAACTQLPTEGAVPPVITSFVASSNTIGADQSVTLTWSVSGATVLLLDPGGVDVTGLTQTTLQPTQTTTFTLIAANPFGESVREVVVVVEDGEPFITSLTASPEVISGPGESVTLAWVVSSATSLLLEPGSIDVMGLSHTTVTPSTTTTYVLHATNASGTSTRSVQVRVGVVPVIQHFGTVYGPVNPGLSTTLSWLVDDADTLTLRGPGLGAGVSIDGLSEYTATALPAGATFTLVARNGSNEVEASTLAARPFPAFSVLFAGQSNAAGWNVSYEAALAFIQAGDDVYKFGNDYVWKPAYEPLDDCTGQVDSVSSDMNSSGTLCRSGVSAGVSLGNNLSMATNGPVFLIPAALGGSSTTQWQVPSDPFARNTLFGSAAHRARHAEWDRGAPLGYSFEDAAYGAVFWYQGESDATNVDVADAFYGNTAAIFERFQSPDVLNAPIILAQLSSRGSGTLSNELWQRVRETQRRMETGARMPNGAVAAESGARRHLVVTHDLPMVDNSHLSPFGQRELGRRIALAIREHLHGDDVDGTGPRLAQIVHDGASTVRVHADRPIAPPATTTASAYSNYFAVFADGESRAIQSIVLESDRVVRITLEVPTAGPVAVRYMPPVARPATFKTDVIRAATCSHPTPETGLCLPMPAFGATSDAATQLMLRTFAADDEY